MRHFLWALVVVACMPREPPAEPEQELLPPAYVPSRAERNAAIDKATDERLERWHRRQAELRAERDRKEKEERERFCSNLPKSEEPKQLSEDEVAERTRQIEWVEANCTTRHHHQDVTQCQSRCTSKRCRVDCDQFRAFGRCPVYDCPEGTDPEWITLTQHVSGNCDRQARPVVVPGAE